MEASRPRAARGSRCTCRPICALAGNFCFGFLLGGMSTFGLLIGLPIDIRHITFSVTNVAYALVALDFQPDLHLLLLLLGVLGVAVIGMANLVVSFELALLAALRARQVTFFQGWGLLGMVLHRLLFYPCQFLLPPRRTKPVPPQPASMQ